ncbi:interaptin-like [Chironomus tepperi]|uniref:interaptin-like n=1 Tax=Chironomus tepperi TaxID=113505 RepID=UPI00391EE2D7
MIIEEVENLIGYADESDEYVRTIGDHLIKSLFNEPQVPQFDEYGAEFYHLTCQQIEDELKVLFEVSKHFIKKAIRNEETIKMLKNVVSDLALLEYDNYNLISSVIDTIADNYAAQNHVFTMIENLDDEIQKEIDTIAKYCTKKDYRIVEMIQEPKDDGWLDAVIDNGQEFLKMMGIATDESMEAEESPELIIIGNVDTESRMFDDIETDAAKEQQVSELNIFEELEDPEESNLNKTFENLEPIVFNLVVEPENPKIDDKLSEDPAQNAETDEILNFLTNNPEVVKLLLQEVEENIINETVDDSELNDIPDEDNADLKADNQVSLRFDDEVPREEIMIKDANSEKESFEDNSFDLENGNPKDLNVKGIIVKIEYPEEESSKNELKNDQKNIKINPQELEIDSETDPETEIFKNTDDDYLEKLIEAEEILMMEPDFEVETEKNSKSDEPEINEQKVSRMNKNEKIVEKDIRNSEYSDDELPSQPQNEAASQDSKEFVDIQAENLNQETENSVYENSNFENFMKIPDNFWEVPLGFWNSFQNFLQNISKEGDKNVDSNNQSDFDEDLDRKTIIYNPERSDKTPKNSEDSNEIESNLAKLIKDSYNEKSLNDEKSKSGQYKPNESKTEHSENEKNAEEIDEEILNSELLNGEILTGNDEFINPNEFKIDAKDRFDFEEGIEGIDDELVTEIKHNKENSDNFDDNNLKDDYTFEVEDIFDTNIDKNSEDFEGQIEKSILVDLQFNKDDEKAKKKIIVMELKNTT